MKVIALTRGGLAGATVKRGGQMCHSGKLVSDVKLNRKKSAEAIVPSKIREGPNNEGHTAERKVIRR